MPTEDQKAPTVAGRGELKTKTQDRENVHTLEPRFGYSAYVSDAGFVCIAQSWQFERDVVVLHPAEARQLIRDLKALVKMLPIGNAKGSRQ